MALTLGNAHGVVPATVGTLHTATTGIHIIKSIYFHNTNATDRTLQVDYYDGVNTRVLADVTVPGNETFVMDTEFFLANTDQIRGTASATDIDYVISYVQNS